MADFKPKSQLKNATLKNVSKCYVLPVIVNNYQVASVRTLIPDGEEIIGFFSCLTALEIGNKSKQKRTEEEL